MQVIELALLLVAFILLLLAAGSWVDTGRWSLGWLGLAVWVLAILLPRLVPVL
jgi:hypothetical protein